MRILIAEDDLTSRTVLTALLEKRGHTLVVTEDGPAAMAALQAPDRPHLAILDWMMPGLDGVTVCRRIRALDLEPPPYIILLTTKDAKGDVVVGLDAGADDYITKPYDPDELRARVAVGRRILGLQAALTEKISALQHALDEVRTLQGIVPMCANCKKIRDDQGYWNQVEVYMRTHTDARISHGICPECARKLYPELDLDDSE